MIEPLALEANDQRIVLVFRYFSPDGPSALKELLATAVVDRREDALDIARAYREGTGDEAPIAIVEQAALVLYAQARTDSFTAHVHHAGTRGVIDSPFHTLSTAEAGVAWVNSNSKRSA